MTRDDLEDVREFGPLQQILFGSGSFLFSGAFWLAITLLIEHAGHYEEYGFGFLLCAISMIAGGTLAYVGYRLFRMKQARLDKYFPERVPR